MRQCILALALLAALLPPLAGAAAESEGGEEEAAAAEPAEEASDATAADESDATAADASEADAAEEEDEREEEEEEGFCPEDQPLCAYLRSSSARFLTGLNGILTAPADPVGATLRPPKAFDKAKPPALRRSLGFGAGFLQMLYRTFQGAFDLGFAVVPGLPVVSPVPRYKLVPGFTHEDE